MSSSNSAETLTSTDISSTGTSPTGTSPTGTSPTGTGTSPTGTSPTGTDTSPTGTGTSPTGTGTSPTGTGTSPTGTDTSHTGTSPTGTYTSPTGTSTSPTGTSSTYTGTSPTGTSPTATAGTSPTGTSPTGTLPTGTSPTATGTSPTTTLPTSSATASTTSPPVTTTTPTTTTTVVPPVPLLPSEHRVKDPANPDVECIKMDFSAQITVTYNDVNNNNESRSETINVPRNAATNGICGEYVEYTWNVPSTRSLQLRADIINLLRLGIGKDSKKNSFFINAAKYVLSKSYLPGFGGDPIIPHTKETAGLKSAEAPTGSSYACGKGALPAETAKQCQSGIGRISISNVGLLVGVLVCVVARLLCV
ncbi:hypothetical protein B566_EDAN010110 [Ephemera danica]|nr:hypothetical protein B566_EDAN010110 [Ephemera danica]